MEVSGQLHMMAALSSGKEPPVPFDMRVDGPHSPPEYFKRKNFFLVPENNFISSDVHRNLTALSWLLNI
jgi:hypothetical protein